MNAQLAMKTYTTISLYGQLGNHAVVRLPGRRHPGLIVERPDLARIDRLMDAAGLEAARTAAEWAKLPRYYVMDLDKGMAEQVAIDMPTAAEIAANQWLPDAELASLRALMDRYVGVARDGRGGVGGAGAFLAQLRERGVSLAAC